MGIKKYYSFGVKKRFSSKKEKYKNKILYDYSYLDAINYGNLSEEEKKHLKLVIRVRVITSVVVMVLALILLIIAYKYIKI